MINEETCHYAHKVTLVAPFYKNNKITRVVFNTINKGTNIMNDYIPHIIILFEPGNNIGHFSCLFKNGREKDKVYAIDSDDPHRPY